MRHKKHRCPDCDQQCRYVNMDGDASENEEVVLPPAAPRSERAFSPESHHDVEPMDDMDFEGPAEDAAADVARAPTPEPDVDRAALPNFEIPLLEPFSPPLSPVARSITPRPASPIRDNFCPRCHRDCNCPHVENPNVDFAPAPVRRPRAPRRITTEEAWARLGHIEDITGVDLPAPEPVIMETPFMIVDNGPLTADRQTQTIRRPTFQVVLYDTGVVVLRGIFTGVSLNSKMLALAAKQPTVIFNDPDDPAEQIAAGYNHVVIRTQLGRLFTLGRGIEGQLGATKYRRRCRQAASSLNMAHMRRLPPGENDVVFEDVKASGNVTRAKAKDGPWFVCGEGHKALLTRDTRRVRGGRRL
uniref:DUF4968 domain-containing protein n=1 Tax=Panagrellus redivivus TaxID=6233 RepID=A0A7E4VKQ4_PANRE